MDPAQEASLPSLERLSRAAFRSVVVLLGLLSLLPVADWIPGGTGSGLPRSHWLILYVLWALSLLAVAAAGWVVVKVVPWRQKARGDAPGDADHGRKTKGSRKVIDARGKVARKGESRAGVGPRSMSWEPVILLLVIPTLLYSLVSREVFDARPLHLDALTQAVQAQIFSQGKLSVPAPEEPGFFSTLLIVEEDGRAFSQFPPGWAALLAVGFLVGLPWLMGPLFAAITAYALYLLLREDEAGEGVSLVTASVFALAPWTVFNAASWMNHLPAVCFILLGSAALLRAIRRPGSWLLAGVGAGCLGMATLIRPLEGVAFGIPATVWVLVRGIRDRDARKGLLAFSVGGIVTLGLLLTFNWIQQGNPLTFGYHLLWGPAHNLGFHSGPWGEPHTPLRGIEFLNGYLLSLQLVFFEAPAPSLVPALVALVLVRKLRALDRFLLVGSFLVVLGYLSYWYEADYLGPRYLLPLAPVIAIWTVRFGAVMAERTGRAMIGRWAYASVAVLMMAGWAIGARDRWNEYRRSDPQQRVSVEALRTPLARDAVVFLPSSWSSQVWARLWATGIPRWEALWVTERMGLCRLELAVSSLERQLVTDPEVARERLLGLVGESAPIIPPPPPGVPMDPFVDMEVSEGAASSICLYRHRAEQVRGGFVPLAFYAQLGPAWTGDGVVLAQDLHENNPRLLDSYPDREAYYLTPSAMSGRVIGFRLVPLDLDSARVAWDELDKMKEKGPGF